jgi:23S rRNA-/tRNA-specific pseudouridylate synthase
MQSSALALPELRHEGVLIPVLHLDARYIAVCKPADMPIDGAADADERPTLESVLQRCFSVPRGIGKLYLVHQLDAVTSGVHLWALSSRVYSSITRYYRPSLNFSWRQDCAAAGKLFERRAAQKTYFALVRGHVAPGLDSWEVDQPIGTDPAGARMRIGGSDAKPAKSSVTVMRRAFVRLHASAALPTVASSSSRTDAGSVLYPVSLLRLSPSSGRRHQLRLHCVFSGHPILGDPTYDRVGAVPDVSPAPAAPSALVSEPERPRAGSPVHWASRCARRTYLHAAELYLPLSGERGGPLRLQAPEPFSAELEDAATQS